MEIKYSVILGFLGSLNDRFATYNEKRGFVEKIELASEIKGLKAVEIVYPFDFSEYPVSEINRILHEKKIEVSSVNVNIKAEKKFHNGALISPDKGIRNEAVNYLTKGMELANELGSKLVTVCPLSDGYDYPFQIDYKNAWSRLVDCIGQAASYNPNVKLSLEYKKSEPRTHVLFSNFGMALHLCDQIGLKNIGTTLDFGHSIYTDENPAQAVYMLHNSNRLFLVHINDNYRNWDWDLLPGTINYWEWLEFLFALEDISYDGWLVADVYPARVDPVKCFSLCFEILQNSQKHLKTIGIDNIKKLICSEDVLSLYREFFQSVGQK